MFLFITVISLFLAYAGQHLLLSDELYFNALAEQMTYEQIQKTIAQSHEWSWLGYCIVPLFNLLKFTLVASCISLGYYFAADRWVFKPFFQVAVQGELVLLLPAVVKLIWFLFVQTDYNLHELQFFFPLSLLNLVESTDIAPWLAYPLQIANLFELAYWLVLAYGIMQAIEMPMSRAFGLVAASYGSGLLVWVAFIMFLTVSLS
ncbi:hypothetical protein CWM47_25515 [Spirosoma pollinicola]|uniref:Yip1 domain-containing protein n=1 Tax=Spirosoma pollinicola TaxID=2057025 RepID=A0A2K8ZC94_9BACT|nr:hypothetical protein CWM47_25515 [Spirosoma pollinicola]